MSALPSGASAPSPCRHCGTPIPAGQEGAFCCAGCAAVHRLLVDGGLDRYYALADDRGAPVAAPPADRSRAWLEPLLARAEAASGGACRLDLDVQGIRCAACVWLIGELAKRRGAQVTVNPALGKARLSWRRGELDVDGWVAEVERFGYQLGPSRKRPDPASRDLLLRLGICAAATMNVMLFAVSFYAGLAPRDGDAFALFTQLSVALSSVVVLVGGWPFFTAALRGLRRGLLHLDLPIALGIALAYGASLVQLRGGLGDRAYLDTLDVFVTLMLVGRWLQQRVVERNRRFLLEDEGGDGILVRRREGSALRLIRAPEIRAGDELLLAPGDLVPVDGELLPQQHGRFSTDWITGEARVLDLAPGALVVAGSFLHGPRAVALRSRTAFVDSPLTALLAAQADSDGRRPAHDRLFARLARLYVVAVLALGGLGLALHWSRGAARAVDVAVALLVVTCPCALGLALPLAHELVQGRLRRAGLFVRRGDLLDRLAEVKKALFDKTGTLTLARLALVDDTPLAGLAPRERDGLYDLAARSNHPVSRCLAEAALAHGAALDAEAAVEETPGQGLSLLRDGHLYRLGRAAFACGDDPLASRSAPELDDETLFTVDGRVAARFAFVESVRPSSGRALGELAAAGLEIWLISGDEPTRVHTLGRRLGLPPERIRGGQRPEDKAALVAHLDRRDTLFVGDGVNDSLAFARAFCAGTPAIERPVMPAKADFFLVGDDLAPIALAWRLAQRLRVVVRRILRLALAYNVLAVGACLAGLMTPLLAALAMPLSSLSILAYTARALRAPHAPRRADPTTAAASPQPRLLESTP